MRRSSIWLILSAYLLILFTMDAAHGEVSVVLVTQTGIGGQIVYPQISGMNDPLVQDEINEMIVTNGRIREHIMTLGSMSTSGGQGINVSTEYTLRKGVGGNDILSILLTSAGKMPNGRLGHARTPMNFSLPAGRQLMTSDIFPNSADAAAYLEQYVSEFIEPQLSSYMENNSLVPVPIDRFYLDEAGIVFCYESDDLSMLSGDSGAIELKFYELIDYLDLSVGGILDKIGLDQWYPNADAALSSIKSAIENGTLPGIHFGIGTPLQEALSTYRQLSDPDFYPGGMFFELEDARYRGVQILSNIVEDDYSSLVISGIRTSRFNLFSLITGRTSQAEWRELLGSPITTETVNPDTAVEYGVPESRYDSYQFGLHTLTLYANEENLLAMIELE